MCPDSVGFAIRSTQGIGDHVRLASGFMASEVAYIVAFLDSVSRSVCRSLGWEG